MIAAAKMRLLTDFKLGDIVRTPSGRNARVLGFWGASLKLAYVDDGDELHLSPLLVTNVAPAPQHAFPPAFFKVKKGEA